MTFFTSLKTKIYDLTPPPETISQTATKQEKKQNSSTNSTAFQLIPDLKFPQLAAFTKTSPDGNFLLAAGTYPQQIRVFDLHAGALKFQRNLTSDAVAGAFLGSDWRKLALVCSNREVTVQGQGGTVFNKRVPMMPRDCEFADFTGVLNVCGSGKSICQLDLVAGKFRSCLEGDQDEYLQICSERSLEMLFACGERGVSAFDERSGLIGGFLNEKIISVHSEGMRVVCGSAGGDIYEYDVRSSIPVRKISFGGEGVKQVRFYENFGDKGVMGCDSRQLRVFEPNGDLKCYIEPSSAIHGFETFTKSGLILMACETPLVQNYYVPDLGPSPLWAKDLDEQIQQIDIQQQVSQYADHRFVTENDLKQLNLLSLIGSESVIPQMHGYYVPKQLIEKAMNLGKGSLEIDLAKIEEQKRTDQFRAQRDKIQINEDNEKLKEQELSDERFQELYDEVGGLEVNQGKAKPKREIKSFSKKHNKK